NDLSALHAALHRAPDPLPSSPTRRSSDLGPGRQETECGSTRFQNLQPTAYSRSPATQHSIQLHQHRCRRTPDKVWSEPNVVHMHRGRAEMALAHTVIRRIERMGQRHLKG